MSYFPQIHKPKTITCDACGRGFTLTASTIKNRLSDDILFQYFQCPHCEAAFLISAADGKFRKLLAKRRKNYTKKGQSPWDQEEVRRLSQEQKLKYTSRFRKLYPNGGSGEE